MSDLFTDAEQRRLIVDDVAARRGLAAWVIEKDLWVCWVLARLHEIPDLPELTFKGGTSLSKVHGARYSSPPTARSCSRRWSPTSTPPATPCGSSISERSRAGHRGRVGAPRRRLP